MSAPHIPILRQGRVYKSLDVQTVPKLGTDEAAAEISFACADMIKYDLHKMGIGAGGTEEVLLSGTGRDHEAGR